MTQKTIYVALDMEWYDQSQSPYYVKEIGISSLVVEGQEMTHKHIVVQDHLRFVNRYCPTSKLGFIFGNSMTLRKNSAYSLLEKHLLGMPYETRQETSETAETAEISSVDLYNVHLIVHNGTHDKKVLQEIGINLDRVIKIHDTGKIFD